MSSSNQDDDAYFKDWYKKNGETLNTGRRDRYKTDPDYRAAVLRRNRDARVKRRAEAVQERTQQRAATRLRVGSRSWKTVEQEIPDAAGGTATGTLFTIGALARSIGRSVQAVRLWERQGHLPETPLRNKKGDRLYSADMVETIRQVMEAQGKLPENSIRSRPEPKGLMREVRFVGGKVTVLKLYRVGVLAEAIQRTVVTVEILEGKGYLPETPFRASGTRYRLYTLPMIESVQKAFEARGGEIRGVDAWKSFEAEVRADWKAQNVFGAEFTEQVKALPPAKGKPKKVAPIDTDQDPAP